MSHHQIPRLDGDQAERCDGNLPFASRLMAVLSMTGHWAGKAFAEGGIPFSGGSSNGGFWFRNVENALSFNGD
jgi:hypothetical protein